jgi:peptidoglycan lytic transglycosylase
MGRWLVILSLAMVQCPDIATAEPPLPAGSGIPVPKPRPVRPAPAVTHPAAPPPGELSVRESAQASAQESSTFAQRWSAQEPSVERFPVQNSPVPGNPARSVPEAQAEAFENRTHDWTRDLRSTIEADAPRRSVRYGSGCIGGRRIISAYYWEGKRTASGQLFDPNGMTAAHRTLPFGTRLTVSNPRTGQSVIVVVNDRGPFVSGIDLDLSLGAAQAIGMKGTGAVCIE